MNRRNILPGILVVIAIAALVWGWRELDEVHRLRDRLANAEQSRDGLHATLEAERTAARAKLADDARRSASAARVASANTDMNPSTSTHAAVQARYERAQALARAGDGAGALGEFLWCFDEGMRREPAFAGVRLSFLLSSIKTLGETYPAALDALKDRRDNAEERLVRDSADSGAARDFAALNRTLGDNAMTLQAFDRLPVDDPRRLALAGGVYEPLVSAQRYSDALSAMPFERMVMTFDTLSPDRPLPGNMPNADLVRAAQRGIVIANAAKNIEVLAGAGALDQARALANKVLALDSSPTTNAILQQHLTRAGHPDLLAPKPE